MQLEGTLGQFPLAELIHIIVGSSVTGVLSIGDGASTGQMFCRDGRFYHAATSTAQGFDAVGALFAIADAPFQFTANITTYTVTIDMHPDSFVERAEVLAQQWTDVRQHLQSVDWTPVACVAADHAPEHLSKIARMVFAAINGQRSVVALADRLGMPLLEVGSIVSKLVEMELVRMEPSRASIAGFSSTRHSSLLERMMAKTAVEVVPQRPAEAGGLMRRLGFSRH